jgi:glutamate synthase (NADPH/NADH) small chain
MNKTADCNSKYAWSLIGRAGLPKRGASDRISDFGEIYSDFDEETVKTQASRCIQCPSPLCMQGCPLANRIPEWLALAAQGRFMEAAALSRSTSNMPEICSRVCPQEKLCEGACILNAKSEPVSIGSVERFINDYAFRQGFQDSPQKDPNGFRVAVVGSGPGGIACADQLSREGVSVTLFESMSIPGGLLVNGIPSFKLDKAIVERRIDMLRAHGVDVRLGVRVGWDVSLETLRSDYDAVFLGVGAQRAKSLDVPIGNLGGIADALPFLIKYNVAGPHPDLPEFGVRGRRVVVLGGGDTAMDCLRTALRAGASDTVCLYRRDLANMPGNRREFLNAIEEGARFEFLTNPVGLTAGPSGSVRSVRCIRMELGEPDASGRRKPRPVAGSEFEVPADLVIVAYGFEPVPFPKGSGFDQIRTDDWGGLAVDKNQMTSLPGVFAGGDSVRGPSLVVHAVRDARKAAQGILRHLRARGLSRPPAPVPQTYSV